MTNNPGQSSARGFSCLEAPLTSMVPRVMGSIWMVLQEARVEGSPECLTGCSAAVRRRRGSSTYSAPVCPHLAERYTEHRGLCSPLSGHRPVDRTARRDDLSGLGL